MASSHTRSGRPLQDAWSTAHSRGRAHRWGHVCLAPKLAVPPLSHCLDTHPIPAHPLQCPDCPMEEMQRQTVETLRVGG